MGTYNFWKLLSFEIRCPNVGMRIENGAVPYRNGNVV